MFCEIIETRREGLRLRPDEWPAPIVGDLRMVYVDGRANNSRRTIRQATQWVSWGTQMVPGPRIIDPQWIDVFGDAMVMRGTQLHVLDGRIYEADQLWIVRPRLSMDGPALPTFDCQWGQQLPHPEIAQQSESVSEQWLREQSQR